MLVDGKPMRPIWSRVDGTVEIIDQTRLPHELVMLRLHSLDDAAVAISTMQVRGAPLIGATAAYGVALAMAENSEDAGLAKAVRVLTATRPTAVNLRWALGCMNERLANLAPRERVAAAWRAAAEIAEEDVGINAAIGRHGLKIIEQLAEPGKPLQILTHCNAGWLATVDWGTATAPIYAAHDAGIPVHVWSTRLGLVTKGLV